MTNEELVAEYQNGNERAFEQLLASNKGIIGTLLKKWWTKVENGSLTADELKGECQFAFFLAASEYSPSRKCSFASYAFNRIHWWLIKTIDKPVPKNSNGQPIVIVSMSEVVPGSDNLTYADMIPDEDSEQELQSVLENFSNKSLRDKLIYLIDSICTEREKAVLLLRYGVGCKQCSQQVIAKSLGISNSRVQQIETEALFKLRKSSLKDSIFSGYQIKSSKVKENDAKEVHPSSMKSISEQTYEEALRILNEL